MWIPVAGQVAIALVVRHDQDDVWSTPDQLSRPRHSSECEAHQGRSDEMLIHFSIPLHHNRARRWRRSRKRRKFAAGRVHSIRRLVIEVQFKLCVVSDEDMPKKNVSINRAPVLTLWAAIVAQWLGFNDSAPAHQSGWSNNESSGPEWAEHMVRFEWIKTPKRRRGAASTKGETTHRANPATSRSGASKRSIADRAEL